jgi:hypothetical protein
MRRVQGHSDHVNPKAEAIRAVTLSIILVGILAFATGCQVHKAHPQARRNKHRANQSQVARESQRQCRCHVAALPTESERATVTTASKELQD